MDTYRLNSNVNSGLKPERISDFGLRKVLGIRTPQSAKFSLKPPVGQDSYMYSRKKIKMDERKITKNIFLFTGAILGGVALFSSLVKKLGLVRPRVNQLLTKAKALFKKH